MKEAFISNSFQQTQSLGKAMAKKILKEGPQKRAVVLALMGDLGGGKTTFVQGFAKGLGIKEKILSPTFVILKKFQFNNLAIKQFNNFYHIDCYRIKKPKEILELGFKEIIADPKNIVVIEWAERVKTLLPKTAVWLNFKFISHNQRRVSF